MSEILMIYKAGDRFATMSEEGKVIVWQVTSSGCFMEPDETYHAASLTGEWKDKDESTS